MTSNEANRYDAIVLFCLFLLRTLMWFIMTCCELVVSCSGSVFSVGERSCSYQKHNITFLRNTPQLLLNHCAVLHCARNTFMRFHVDSFMSQDTRSPSAPAPSPSFCCNLNLWLPAAAPKLHQPSRASPMNFTPKPAFEILFFLSILLSSTAVTQIASCFKLIADPFPLWSQT